MTRRRTLYLPTVIATALLVACALVALLALSEQKVKAAFPGMNGKIAFDREPLSGGNKPDVFVVDPEGSGLQDLTKGPNSSKTKESEPSFSQTAESSST